MVSALQLQPWEIAEQALLRMVLRDQTVLDRVQIAPEQMSRDAHIVIWRAAERLHRGGRPVVPAAVQVVLAEMLADQPTVRDGACAYVQRLHAGGASVDLEAALEHATTVREYAAVRLAASKLGELGRLAAAHDRRVLEMLATLAAEVAGTGVPGAFVPWEDTVTATLSDLENRDTNEARRMRSGLPSLDALRVFREGEYVLLGARTSMGKSALALRIAAEMAGAGRGVLYVSMEMRDTQLCRRALSAHAGVPAIRLRTGVLHDGDWEALIAEAARQHSWTLHTMDRGRRDMEAVGSAARQLQAQGELSLVVVDYIQRLHMAPGRNESRRETLNRTSGELKDLAGDLSCAVLALAQISREGDTTHSGGRPHLTDLKESGNLEEDADGVLLLSPNLQGRPYAEWRAQEPRSVLLDIAKSRDGEQKDVPLHFWPSRVHFEEAALV